MRGRFSIRFERRLDPPVWLSPAMPFFAILAALILGAIILVGTGRDPVDTFSRMFQTAFTKPGAMSATLLSATPLVLTGLAAAIAFRMRAWNIGADGQLMIGALFAAAAGTALGHLGLFVALPAMLVAGIAGGALWVAGPALLRMRFGTNEVLTTLMLNYVAPLILSYLIFNSRSYWRDLESPTARVFPQAKTIPDAAFWPSLGSDIVVPMGFGLAAVLAVLLTIMLRSTRFGFQIRVTADSPAAGEYAGIRTGRTFLIVMLMSGALAGLAGASQIGDFSHRLEPRVLEFSALGYTGIAVAALARYQPLAVVLSAVFIGGITNAGFSLQGPDLPLGLIGVIQGLLLLCVAGSEVLTRYRVIVEKHSAPAAASPAFGSGGGVP